jgi:hypothetical protein
LESVPKQELILAIIEAPRHLLHVGGKMFDRDFMPRAHHSTLEQRECGFNRVHGDAQPASFKERSLLLWIVDVGDKRVAPGDGYDR